MSTYDVSGILPVERLSRGTQLLVLSPPLLGARELSYRFIARGLDAGEACIVVSTDRVADRVAAVIKQYTTAEDALSRLGVVDCSGQETETECVVVSVGSPADLTGIGIAVSRLIEEFGAEHDGLRLTIDSVSTLLVYSDFDRVFRFVHAFTGRTESIGACALLHLQSDTDGTAVDALQGVVDGRVELREHGDTAEYRLRGLEAAGSEWEQFDATGPTSVAVREASGDTVADTIDESPTSLHDLIERMVGGKLTLTVCNFTGQEEALTDVTAYFDRLNVATRTISLPTETPTNLAILHRGAETLATNHISTLQDWIQMEALGVSGAETAERTLDLTRPAVIERATRDEYTVDNEGKLQLVRISRLLELRALRAGAGELHAGFQRLTRIDDELGTRRLYERIAATDVDVHLYGTPGRVPNADAYTVHADETDELAHSWFVIYDGAGSEPGSLVTEETEPERYSGFWTYRPEVTQTALTYLRATY